MAQGGERLRRGFVKECEGIALHYRAVLKLKETDPLSPELLAEHLAVPCIQIFVVWNRLFNVSIVGIGLDYCFARTVKLLLFITPLTVVLEQLVL